MITSDISTIIIGKESNLSKCIAEKMTQVILVSSRDISQCMEQLDSGEKVNIIFNNFQTAKKLSDISNPTEYVERTIGSTAEVLDCIKTQKIEVNKIIYTSSSSVYGNNIFCSENDPLMPLNLHAALKIANEKLIEKFAQDNNINYTIARIFNMYGREDNFSVVSKIIDAVKNKKLLPVINNGKAIRDFIHIGDVVNVYVLLLKSNDVCHLNIGTGNGVSVKNILDYLRHKEVKLGIQNIEKEELKISTANNEKLLSLLGGYEFLSVEKYILESLGES